MAAFGEDVSWQPARPRVRPLRFLISWVILGASAGLAAAIVPGFDLQRPAAALVVAGVLGVLNALLPPVFAALPIPYALPVGFIGILLLDAGLLLAAGRLLADVRVDSFAGALLASLLIAAIGIVLQAPTTTTSTPCVSRAASRAASVASTTATFPASSSSRSMDWHARCCATPSATAVRRTWRDGWRTRIIS